MNPERTVLSYGRLLHILTVVAVLLASNGVIVVISTNQVSHRAVNTSRWEPTSASASNWVHGWTELDAPIHSFMAYWNGTWINSSELTAPNGLTTGDVYLSFDSVRNRYVFVVIDLPTSGYRNIWYGYSVNSTGTSWQFRPTAVFPASAGNWDYPSIGVDASGRIVIGAVQYPGPTGFYTVLSTDGGSTFSARVRVGTKPGSQSRVVATNDRFQAFVPTLNASNLPTAVDRYESTSGTSWTGPFNLASFGAPLNNSPSDQYCGSQGCGAIFYAPLLDAKGYTNGLWSVTWQFNNGGYNNAYICTSSRGCGIVNSQQDDQFLVGTSVSGDGGYWVSYLTYSTLVTRQLPLIMQGIYFPPGQSGIGGTTNSNIEPRAWARFVPGQRCTVYCFGSGDYQGVASNPYAAASTPFVNQSSRKTDLFQAFVQDPQARPNVPNFTPNFIPFPEGAILPGYGAEVPPETAGIDPSLKTGVPSPVISH